MGPSMNTGRSRGRATLRIGASSAVAMIAVACAACSSGRDEQAAQATATIDHYCLDCHNYAEQTGDLSLEHLALTDVSKHPDIWEAVVRKLDGRMMPPGGEPLPDVAATNQVVAYLDERARQGRGRASESRHEVAAPLESHGVR